MILTIFSIPKAFRGHINIIQRNAIRSWTLLHPACEILLFGDDEGTAEVAAEFGLRHIPKVARNQQGTPFLSDVFEQAQRLTSSNILCYVNADVILMNDFRGAVAQVAQQYDRFLIVGQRWDADVKELLDFRSNWEELFRSDVNQYGTLHDIVGIDYFAFGRGILGEIPPFTVGRAGWDNWMIYRARSQGIAVIDATPVVMAVHQNHDYSHIQGGQFEAYEGPEAIQNRQLAGVEGYFDVHDATYIFTTQGICPALDDTYLWQRLNRQTVLNRFRGNSKLRRFLLIWIIRGWKLYLAGTPKSIGRKLVYNWLAWTEIKQEIPSFLQKHSRAEYK